MVVLRAIFARWKNPKKVVACNATELAGAPRLCSLSLSLVRTLTEIISGVRMSGRSFQPRSQTTSLAVLDFNPRTGVGGVGWVGGAYLKMQTFSSSPGLKVLEFDGCGTNPGSDCFCFVSRYRSFSASAVRLICPKSWEMESFPSWSSTSSSSRSRIAAKNRLLSTVGGRTTDRPGERVTWWWPTQQLLVFHLQTLERGLARRHHVHRLDRAVRHFLREHDERLSGILHRVDHPRRADGQAPQVADVLLAGERSLPQIHRHFSDENRVLQHLLRLRLEIYHVPLLVIIHFPVQRKIFSSCLNPDGTRRDFKTNIKTSFVRTFSLPTACVAACKKNKKKIK